MSYRVTNLIPMALSSVIVIGGALSIPVNPVWAETPSPNNSIEPTGKNAAEKETPPKNHLKDGYKAVKDRDWNGAIQNFEEAQKSKPLSMQALLALAYSYRKVEECSKAIEPLNKIEKKSKNRKLSKRNAKIVRNGMFLLARCYAKQNDAGKALFILNGYLLDPKKYASEIRQSLRLLDFGGLKTQSDFRDYMAAAEKALAKIPQPDSFQSLDSGSGGDYEKPADPGASASGF